MKGLATGVLAAALVTAGAALADPVGKGDRANALQSCSTLRSTLGAATFAQTYGGGSARAAFARCVAQMRREAHDARHAAVRSCAAKAKGNGKGVAKARARCAAATARGALRQQVHQTANAAQQCKAERAQGRAAFEDLYGTNVSSGNGTNRNAFGKCVSQKVNGQGGAASQAGTRLHANLKGATGSGKFAARIDLAQSRLCYTLSARRLTGVTSAHVHTVAAQTIGGTSYAAGDIVVPLAAPTAGTVTECIAVPLAVLQAIAADNDAFYVNVHTTAAPGGAIQGTLR